MTMTVDVQLECDVCHKKLIWTNSLWLAQQKHYCKEHRLNSLKN